MKKLVRFFMSIKGEMKKVRWPNKKEMVIYSLATISFIIVFALFFSLTDFVLAELKLLVK